MGYETMYSLEFNKIDKENKCVINEYTREDYTIENEIAKKIVICLNYDEDDFGENPCIEEVLSEPYKWYDWEDDMRKISLEYPDYIFTMYGEGEDRDDNWKACIYQGKIEIVKAEIVYPEIDISALIEKADN